MQFELILLRVCIKCIFYKKLFFKINTCLGGHSTVGNLGGGDCTVNPYFHALIRLIIVLLGLRLKPVFIFLHFIHERKI